MHASTGKQGGEGGATATHRSFVCAGVSNVASSSARSCASSLASSAASARRRASSCVCASSSAWDACVRLAVRAMAVVDRVSNATRLCSSVCCATVATAAV